MHITRTILLVPALLVPASVQAQMPATTVDLCLVLAADISASVSTNASRIQRAGHAEALTHPEVLSAIARTRTGKIAVSYVEWSSHGAARTVLPWRVIENTSGAREAAKVIRDDGHRSDTSGHTSISWAITFAARSLLDCPAKSDRTVIDSPSTAPTTMGLRQLLPAITPWPWVTPSTPSRSQHQSNHPKTWRSASTRTRACGASHSTTCIPMSQAAPTASRPPPARWTIIPPPSAGKSSPRLQGPYTA
jgi:hypothetical protein